MNQLRSQVSDSGSLKGEFSENVETSDGESYRAALCRTLQKCQENVNAVLTEVIGNFEVPGARGNNLTKDPQILDTVVKSLSNSDSDNEVINVPQIQGYDVTLPLPPNTNDSLSSTLTATPVEISPENGNSTQE